MSLWRSNLVRWSAWWFLLAILSLALLTPQPPLVAEALLPAEMMFKASKAIHVSAYALMTFLIAWLPATRRQCVWLVLVLVLHAGLTEVGQTFVPGRTGRFADVIINLIGISLGLALWLWLARSPAPAAATDS